MVKAIREQNSVSNLVAKWNVAVGNLVNELGIWVKEHDMKMLYGMNRFQRPPILEPDVLPRRLAWLAQKGKEEE